MAELAAEGGGKMIGMPAPKTPDSSGAVPQGGGFQFEPEQLETIIQQWKDLLEDLEKDKADADLMAAVRPPGKEFASGDFANLANPSGQAFVQQNKRMRDYVAEYVEALEDAKRSMTATESDSRSAIAKAASQGS